MPEGATPGHWRRALGIGLIAIALVALPFVAGLAGNSWVRILDFALLYFVLELCTLLL